MNFLTSSLRNKLIAVFLVPTLLSVLIYGTVAYEVVRTELEAELGRRSMSVGQALSSQLSGGITAKQLLRLDPTKMRVIERMRRRLQRVKRATGARRVYIFDRDLKSLVDTRQGVALGQNLYTLQADRLEVERAWERGRATTSILFRDDQELPYKTAYVPLFLDDERQEVAAMIGVEASASYFTLLTTFGSVLLLMGLVSVALVVVVGVLFARRLTRPVEQLAEAARRLGRGQFDEPIPIGEDGDEIRVLGQAMEQMRLDVLGRDRQMQMMLSGIAHEVRNPLGGMELFCGLLREDLAALDPDEHRENLQKVERIERELHYLDKVVTDFLEFARSKPLELERFSGADLAQEMHALLCGQMLSHDCEFVIEVPQDLELTAEQESLRRALINALRNAYQASPEGGQVTLCMRAPDPHTRVIEVRDTGQGIPPEVMREILTPFYTTKEKGSGLGLALIQKTLETHGGSLEIQSEVGQGTTLVMTLPFLEQIERPEAHIPQGWLG